MSDEFAIGFALGFFSFLALVLMLAKPSGQVRNPPPPPISCKPPPPPPPPPQRDITGRRKALKRAAQGPDHD